MGKVIELKMVHEVEERLLSMMDRLKVQSELERSRINAVFLEGGG